MLRRLSGAMPVRGLAQIEHCEVSYYYLLGIYYLIPVFGICHSQPRPSSTLGWGCQCA